MTASRGALATTGAFDEPERWRAHLGAAFSDLVPGPLDRELAPAGTLRGGRLGAASVFTVSGSPQAVRRTSTAVRCSPADMVKACVQLRGRATVHQDDREIVLVPGQLALYDIGRPYELRLEGSWSCAVLAVRRDQVALPAARLDGAMSRPYRADRGPGLLLSQFITATVGELGAAGPNAAGKLGEAAACLLAGALTGDGDITAAGGSDTVLNDAVLNQVLDYINARLADPRLGRATVAAAHRMSPRTLDRLFLGQAWSVSGYIRHERLEAVRRDLENPALRQRSVAALAARWCFFDAAHFSRLFRENYGYPPSQARP
jgi:AraC-like DNA-binding protein